MLVLPGCFWVSETGSQAETVSYTEADAARAEADVRASIPAIEAYYADNGTYGGLTLAKLRTRYDAGITGIRVVEAGSKSYCVESVSGPPFHKAGPAAPILGGTCADPELAPAPPQPIAPPEYDAQTNVRAALPAIGAYFADNGTYVGMTPKKLRATYDLGLPVFVIVSAKAKTYCIESSSRGETFHYAGPRGPVRPGGC